MSRILLSIIFLENGTGSWELDESESLEKEPPREILAQLEK